MYSCLNCNDEGFCYLSNEEPAIPELCVDEDGFCIDEESCPQYEDEFLMYGPDYD